MNIWLIQTGEPLPLESDVKKMRTAVLADKLVERGHSVLWWTSAFDHFKKDWIVKKDTEITIKDGLSIQALKGTGYKKNVSLSRFIDHRIISWKFKKLASKMPKPDVMVASMPPYDLAYKAVIFAKRNSIPILVDIRDPWPDIFLNHIPSIFQKFAKLILYKDFKMTKKALKMADGLIVVTNTFLGWGLKYAERKKSDKDKVFYLGAERVINSGQDRVAKQGFIEKLKDNFVVVFIGTFALYHNPAILLNCAEKLKDEKICFVLAGKGEFFGEIQRKAEALPNVIVPGWLNTYQIEELLRYSHVGICPTSKEVELFPNKAFTYLSAGLPIISAFKGELKEIIEKYNIGFYYPPNDIDVLVSCIKRLYEDKELYQKMSENARKVFDEMFDADKIYEEYAEYIEKLYFEFKRGKNNENN